ncbi:MAG: hypothetical protein Q9191_005934 [Dirinaria sp. TL-2023a]
MAEQITAADEEMAQMLNANAIGSKEIEQRTLRSKVSNSEPTGSAKRKQEQPQDVEAPLKKRGRGRPRKNGTAFVPKKPAENPDQPPGNLKKPTRARIRKVNPATDNLFDVSDDDQDGNANSAKAVGKKSTQTIGAKPAKLTANKRKAAAFQEHESSVTEAKEAPDLSTIAELEIGDPLDPGETSCSGKQRKTLNPPITAVDPALDGNDVLGDDSFVPEDEDGNGYGGEEEHGLSAVSISSPPANDNTVNELQLFGQKRGWNIILEGAQNVGVSVQKGKTVRDKPSLQTNTITELLRKIKEASTLYSQLGSSEVLEAENIRGEEEARLITLSDEIYETVDGLSESSSGSKKSQMIQDIYAYAIPNMVFFLRAALKCRNTQYSQGSDLAALREVIKIQDMILDLCQKARQWKAKPLTDRPITGSTSQKIGPYMRDLRKTFGEELERRERAVRQQSYDEAFAESHRRRDQLRERQKALNARKSAEQRIKQMEELRNRPSPWRSHTQPMQNEAPMAQMMPPPAPDSQVQGLGNEAAQWTTAENLELITQLTRREIRYLPAYERYLAMLDSPLLRDKDVEDIRERALYYKDIMIAQAGPEDYILSIQ